MSWFRSSKNTKNTKNKNGKQPAKLDLDVSPAAPVDRPSPSAVSQLIERPSKSGRAREAAITFLEVGVLISDATDLLAPLKVVCGCLKKALEVAKVASHLT